MSRHDDSFRIRHMLDHSAEAPEMARNRSRKDLDRGRQLTLALIKLAEIVGEAADRASTQTRDAFPSVPWLEIVGLRNRLVHGYDEVDLDVLWEIVRQDLPALAPELECILNQLDSR